MTDLDPATTTQLRNIEQQTGRTVDDFVEVIEKAGLTKHGEMIAHLKTVEGLSHGNANLIAHMVRERQAGGPSPAEDLLANQYRGAKAALRPILDKVSDLVAGLGDDVETRVLKTGVSFRRRTQFALVEPKSATRVQLGLNLDEDPDDPRVVRMGGMCTHKIDLSQPADVDDAVAGLLHVSYERSA